MPEEPDASVDAALRSLSVQYARGVDRRDLETFVAVFERDATLEVVGPGIAPGRVTTGRDQLATVIDRIARWDATFHLLGQSSYEVHGDGATGEVYCTAHHRAVEPGSTSDHVMFIRYLDEYRRGDDGEWRIATRTVHVDWSETHHHHAPEASR